MKKTIRIDYDDWDLDRDFINKLVEMGVIENDRDNGGIRVKKTGTLIIEFIEE